MDGNRTALYDELAETFDDDVGLESTKVPFGDYNESLSEIAAEARRLAPRPVVDLGCGTGALFAGLQRDGTEVEALKAIARPGCLVGYARKSRRHGS